jgi:ubiquitin-like domain-containing CTD phosphatase 1
MVRQVKMRELGVSTHPDYRLTCMLDHKAMITVQTDKYGGFSAYWTCCYNHACKGSGPRFHMVATAGVFDCKPLGFLWGKFPEVYGPHNTIMFDDLRRNYVMNKQNG